MLSSHKLCPRSWSSCVAFIAPPAFFAIDARTIGPESRRRFYRTMVSINTLVSVGWIRSGERGRSLSLSRHMRSIRPCHAKTLSQIDQLSKRIGIHLLHHLAAMCLYSDFTDAELAANLFIQKA